MAGTMTMNEYTVSRCLLEGIALSTRVADVIGFKDDYFPRAHPTGSGVPT